MSNVNFKYPCTLLLVAALGVVGCDTTEAGTALVLTDEAVSALKTEGSALIPSEGGDVLVTLDVPALEGQMCDFAGDWAERVESANSIGMSIAADGAGNIFLGGAHSGQIDFGDGPLSHSGGSDAFVAKYADDGTYLWSKTFTGDDKQNATAVEVDGAGNLVVMGTFIGSIDIDGEILTNPAGIGLYLAKFDTCGHLVWAQGFEGHLEGIEGDMALDGEGNIVVTGGFYNGGINLGGESFPGEGGSDIFVAKYDPDGGHLWSKAFGSGVHGEQGHAVAVDGEGSIVVTGILTGAVNFGGGSVGSAGSGDVFVVKFDATGGHMWSDVYGDAGWQRGDDVAVDGLGNILLTGKYRGDIEFGGDPLEGDSDPAVYLAKLDANGGHLWSKGFVGDDDYPWLSRVAVDAVGNVLLAGSVTESLDLEGGPMVPEDGAAMYLAKYKPSGEHVSSELYGGQETYARDVALDGAGNELLTGLFRGELELAQGVTNPGYFNAFLAKIDI